MNENPIACSLDTAALANRLAEIESIGAGSLLSHHREGAVHALAFRVDAQTQQRLEEVLAAERECCPFLKLDLKQGEEQLTLTIAAPAEAAAVATELAASFARGLDQPVTPRTTGK